ncbi:precorrin-6y C5,15-methyltransferase (decarboxylating) subunit CbiE [Cucumibacter marinus]|uniref:precorrin-6y C5,15-methyltransferase (decarboxylating) subunit CbiE n=1 Tax=Cucumibacter marinus TaxID=1121252 RepID=UPI000427DA46|nr:precorrin-6y C5,15-methyltransferase (decarboxylating) subunit CbiE [Cucumibacter marinus]
MSETATTPWLTVIGVTEAGTNALGPEARAAIEAAEHIFGPARAIGPLLTEGKKAEAWQTPLEAMIAQLMAVRGTSTVVLATGDPMWFGMGATLARHLAADEYEVIPAPGAFSLAAARLKWPLQNCAAISLHGRRIETLEPHIQPGLRILALTGDAETVRGAAALLEARGFGGSQLTVLNHMGGSEESRVSFSADQMAETGIADFNTLAIDCVAGPNALLRPAVPGLPDEAFVHDGQLTKREVRAATLAKLAPAPGLTLWDIGAGCGSVGIEWMRGAPGARAVAFEKDAERRTMIEQNRLALGVPGLEVMARLAPDGFVELGAPDALFLGGDVANENLFEACWRALKPGGVLVANGVTLEAEAALIARHAKLGGDLARLAISHLDTVGPYRAFRPRMAVTQWAVSKPHQSEDQD